jgi:hypothetical protein
MPNSTTGVYIQAEVDNLYGYVRPKWTLMNASGGVWELYADTASGGGPQFMFIEDLGTRYGGVGWSKSTTSMVLYSAQERTVRVEAAGYLDLLANATSSPPIPRIRINATSNPNVVQLTFFNSTGVIASDYGQVSFDANNITTTGNITAGYYYGDGRYLTNLPKAANATFADSSNNSANLGGKPASSYLTSTGMASEASYLYVNGTRAVTGGDLSLAWSNLTSYPAACSSGQYISALSDSPTCSTPAGGGSTNCTSCDTRFLLINPSSGDDILYGDLLSGYVNGTIGDYTSNQTSLYVTNSTYILLFSPDTNYATSTKLYAGSTYYKVFMYDSRVVSLLDYDGEIYLNFYIEGTTGGVLGSVDIKYDCTGTFNEYNITWNNNPISCSKTLSLTDVVYPGPGWVKIDITSIVQGWDDMTYAGTGLVQIEASTVIGLTISSDNAASNKPYLSVEYVASQAWNIDSRSIRSLDLSTNIVSSDLVPASSYDLGSLERYTNITMTKDTYIDSSVPTANYGTLTYMNFGEYCSFGRYPIQAYMYSDIALYLNRTFDKVYLSSYISNPASIGNELQLYYDCTGNLDETGMTWNNNPVVCSKSKVYVVSTSGVNMIDITDIANAWKYGTANGAGLISLRTRKYICTTTNIYSREYTIASERPYYSFKSLALPWNNTYSNYFTGNGQSLTNISDSDKLDGYHAASFLRTDTLGGSQYVNSSIYPKVSGVYDLGLPHGTSVQITATKDAHVSLTYPNTNYGSDKRLSGDWVSNTNLTLIGLGDTSSYTNITGATITFYVNMSCPVIRAFYGGCNDFTENTVTYNTQPYCDLYTYYYDAYATSTGWKTIDITAIIQSGYTTIALAPWCSPGELIVDSREASNKPYFTLNYTGSYWKGVYSAKVYAGQYYAHNTTIVPFDRYEDSELIKSIVPKVSDKGIEYFSVPDEVYTDEYIDLGKLHGLELGTLKELISRIEVLEVENRGLVDKLNKMCNNTEAGRYT